MYLLWSPISPFGNFTFPVLSSMQGKQVPIILREKKVNLISVSRNIIHKNCPLFFVCVCCVKHHLKKFEQLVPVIKVSHWQFSRHQADLLWDKQPLKIWTLSYKSSQSPMRPLDGYRVEMHIPNRWHFDNAFFWKRHQERETFPSSVLECQCGALGIHWTPYLVELLTFIDLKFLF